MQKAKTNSLDNLESEPGAQEKSGMLCSPERRSLQHTVCQKKGKRGEETEKTEYISTQWYERMEDVRQQHTAETF